MNHKKYHTVITVLKSNGDKMQIYLFNNYKLYI